MSNTEYFVYVNAHNGDLVGPFVSQHQAFVAARTKGSQLPNGALIYPTLSEARKMLKSGWTGSLKDSCKLDTSKRIPMFVCSWAEYNTEFDAMLKELETA